MPPRAWAERIRQALAPVVALLASGLAVTAAVSLPDVQRSVLLLYVTDERWVGWAGLALAACLASSALAVFAAPRLGAAPALAFGAVAAVFGLALGDSVTRDAQVAMAFVVLGIGFGALVTGAGLIAIGLPRRASIAAGAGWALPLVAGWPLVTWLLLHGVEEARLALHPPVWALVSTTAAIVAWSSLSVLLEYDDDAPGPRSQQSAAPTGEWTRAWLLLMTTAAVAPLALVVLGFDPTVSPAWTRSVTLLAAAVVAVGLGGTACWVPQRAQRASYLGAVVVLSLLPASVQLVVMTADEGDDRVGRGVLAVLILAGAAGVLVGLARPRLLPAALLLTALGAAGSWVMPTTPWAMVPGCAAMLLGGGAALGASVRSTVGHEAGWRFLCVASVVSLAVGLAATAPLSWALGGSVADGLVDARAAGRVALGVLFSAALVAAAVAAILLGRERDGGPTREASVTAPDPANAVSDPGAVSR